MRFRTFFFLSLAQQPNAGQGCLILEVSRSHTMTHHIWQDSSGRGIGPSQKPLPDSIQHSQETDILAPDGISLSVSLSLCTLSYFFVLIVLALPFVLYCTAYTTQISIHPAGFKPTIPARERPQTLDLDRSAHWNR
jgi:hypothetical protein